MTRRIQSIGYSNVDAEHLVKDSPVFWIRNLEALGVKTEFLSGQEIDIQGVNLSTHPHLVDGNPTISLKSKDGNFNANLALGLAAGRAENVLDFNYKGIPSAAFKDSLRAKGETLLDGGTLDVVATGDLNSINSDLTVSVRFHGVTLNAAGSQIPLDGMTLPLEIRGPIDSPKIKLEADFLKSALTQAGKKRLLGEASEKLGVDLGDDASKDALKEKAGSLLEGFLKKKTEEKSE